MTTSPDSKEIELLRDRMIRENPEPSAERLGIYEREVRANEDLNSVRAYAKLLFDKSVVYPSGIRDVILAFRLTGHEEVASLITSEHVNAYREGGLLFSKEKHAEIYSGLGLRDTIQHMKVFSLTYALSDAKTRTFAKEHFVQIARGLWDEDITTIPKVQRYISLKMVTTEDSIVTSIGDGAL